MILFDVSMVWLLVSKNFVKEIIFDEIKFSGFRKEHLIDKPKKLIKLTADKICSTCRKSERKQKTQCLLI